MMPGQFVESFDWTEENGLLRAALAALMTDDSMTIAERWDAMALAETAVMEMDDVTKEALMRRLVRPTMAGKKVKPFPIHIDKGPTGRIVVHLGGTG